MDVSVIIPIRAEPRIDKCLEAVLAQECPWHFEVIVVENDHSQRLLPLISRYSVSYIWEPIEGSYRARNRGIREARGDILVFLDGDCIPDPGWLEGLLRGFTSMEIGGVAGRIVKHDGHSLVEKAQREFLLRDGLQLLPPIFPAPFAPAGNVAYRAELVRELGGFDESFLSGGDVDFSWRVHLASYRIAYNGRARVRVGCRRTVSAYFRQYYKYGLGHVKLFCKYRSHSGKRILFNSYPFRGLIVATAELLTTGAARLVGRGDAAYALGRILDLVEHTALIVSAFVGSVRYRVVYI